MPGNEKTTKRRIIQQHAANTGRVFTGIPAYVYHQNPNPFQLEAQDFRQPGPDVGPVYVAINPPEGFEGCQLIQNSKGSYISGMPNLIAGRQMRQQAFIQVSMGIG